MTFMTANMLTDSNEKTMMDHESLGQCKLHVLNQMPSVLSIGSRCSNEGYSFVWPDGEDMQLVMMTRLLLGYSTSLWPWREAFQF